MNHKSFCITDEANRNITLRHLCEVNFKSVTAKSLNIITEIVCSLDIFLFVYAAVSKLLNHENFVHQLSLYFQNSLALVISFSIPVFELLIAGLLTLKKFRNIGISCFIILMILFSIYIGVLLLSNKNLPCNCGGMISTLSWKQHFLFNLFFITINLFLIITYKKLNPPLETNKII